MELLAGDGIEPGIERPADDARIAVQEAESGAEGAEQADDLVDGSLQDRRRLAQAGEPGRDRADRRLCVGRRRRHRRGG